jgi:CheY-like chemotaxis protein
MFDFSRGLEMVPVQKILGFVYVIVTNRLFNQLHTGGCMIDRYDIIYVDDEPTMTTIFSQVVSMKYPQWRSITFNDSQSLYTRIEARSISSRVWIVDLMMPGKNGIQIAQAIRASGDFSAVLVGYTALDPQSLGRKEEFSPALDLFSRIIGKQEGFIKVLASLQATVLRQVKA